MSEILSREEWAMCRAVSESGSILSEAFVPTSQELVATLNATIEALAEALDEACLHTSDEYMDLQKWNAIMNPLRDKGWIK